MDTVPKLKVMFQKEVNQSHEFQNLEECILVSFAKVEVPSSLKLPWAFLIPRPTGTLNHFYKPQRLIPNALTALFSDMNNLQLANCTRISAQKASSKTSLCRDGWL